MCGILSVVNLRNNLTGASLAKASAIIRHRGPDDEGFLTWVPGDEPRVWAGNDTAPTTREHFGYDSIPAQQQFKVGFGHRRLSILDLSPAGHQPMLHAKAGLAITFNGEVYNYLEIKAELEQLGHKFNTTCDTEVILHAWEQWGPECLHRFNGMFAFVLLDHRNRKLYAVRDRFGVKPLYYYKNADALYLASEIKQIRTAPGYSFAVNEKIVRQFLAAGAAEHTNNTFDTEVKHLPGGHYMVVDLAAESGKFDIVKWYTLTPKKWKGSYDEAAEQLKSLLTDAVNVRLRSDVTVGSCLSGGLDSSSIVCIAAELLRAKGDFSGQETVTACYDNARYDEWGFAQEVIKQTNAHPHRTFPSFEGLQRDMETFLWHQDEPVGSTSVFSQWAVFKASHEAGLKVMIDGQGADEQLAGYDSNDVPLYAGLMRRAKLMSLVEEARAYKAEKGAWPIGFMLGGARLTMGKKVPVQTVDWLKGTEPARIHSQPASSLHENLLRQLHGEPLPALLRYEDRNSMAWSVESRTPFMDYRLVEFNLGLPERFAYRNGVRKAVLRTAMHGVIPKAIEQRRDKMGFVTPEEVWLKGEGRQWFLDTIDNTSRQFSDIIEADKLRTHIDNIMSGKESFTFLPWRLASLGMWRSSLKKG
ncbi:MAG: asparagine synthase (glutamine-hydrolyzing) [Bacteroidota bacterium]